MNGNGKIFAALLLLMACAFGFGLHALLAERFERGDSYPPYSSFRSDPRGAKALYLALGRVPGIAVRRNFMEPSRLAREKGVTYFFLGVEEGAMRRISREDLKTLAELAARGEPSGHRMFFILPNSCRKGGAGETDRPGRQAEEGEAGR
jgi:hypothetical protein